MTPEPVHAPVFVRLHPRAHKMPEAEIPAALAKPIDEIRKAFAADLPITVVSPDARTIPGRRKISKALRHAGLEPEIVSVLGWDTTYPMPSAKQQKCDTCGTAWLADEPLPCPTCPPKAAEPKAGPKGRPSANAEPKPA